MYLKGESKMSKCTAKIRNNYLPNTQDANLVVVVLITAKYLAGERVKRRSRPEMAWRSEQETLRQCG
jgi:hypothetical protein